MATLLFVEQIVAPPVIRRGGHVIYVLQWLHGLRRLGHEVVFLEFVGSDLERRDEAALIGHFQDVMETWWDPGKAALIRDADATSLAGLDADQVRHLARDAAAVLILAPGYRPTPYPLIDEVRPRVMVDQDPAYTQLWAAEDDPAGIYGEHDLYYSVGVNLGTPRCSLPTLGIDWHPVRNPVVLDWWTPRQPITRDRFTTIADWRGWGYLEFEGRMLGPKAEEFRKVVELPRVSGEQLELVLDIDPEDPDIPWLRQHGWTIERPMTVAEPSAYRDFITGSLAEFTCTKGGYAGTRCGWFSDRSACYLAAGRPVVMQATGFEDLLPTGEGLFAFTTLEEAADAIGAIRGEYERHSAAARALAATYFDSNTVLRQFLSEIGLSQATSPRGFVG